MDIVKVRQIHGQNETKIKFYFIITFPGKGQDKVAICKFLIIATMAFNNIFYSCNSSLKGKK